MGFSFEFRDIWNKQIKPINKEVSVIPDLKAPCASSSQTVKSL